MATNIYQRGTIHWWRRSVTYRSLELDPITVRIPLRTSSLREAKARAAFLETELGTVEAVVENSLRTIITQDDLKAVYHIAFKAALDRYIVRQASTPMFADTHAAANLAYARYFTLLAGAFHPPEADEALRRELLTRGLSEQEADAVFVTVAQHRTNPPIGPNHVADYLRQADVKPTEANMTAVSRVVATAYRNACLEASAAMGRPINRDLIWPVVGGIEPMLGLAAGGDCPGPAPAASSAFVMPSQPAQHSGPAVQPSKSEDGPIDVAISVLAKKAIAHKIAAGEWRDDRARDVNAAIALFVTANGDLMLSEIRQHHVSAMTALFPRLPTRYGHMKGDIEGGLTAALGRGDALRIEWQKDRAKAERGKLPTVGLSATTHNKHLTWLSALVTFADGHGYVVPAIQPSKARSKGKKVKGPKRLLGPLPTSISCSPRPSGRAAPASGSALNPAAS